MQVPAASRRAALGWAALVVAALGLLVLARPPGAAAATTAPEPAAVERGRLIYANNCATCHASDGRGVEVPVYGGVAPSLQHQENPAVDVAYLDLVMSTGRMPPAGSPYDNRDREVVLDAAERADVIAFMRAELDLPGEIPQLGPGEASRGQEVWNGNCAHCHGAIGAGGVAGAGAWTPSVSDKSAQQIVESIRVGPFQMPRFDEGQISDQEALDVAAFMTAIDEEEGTPIFGFLELNPVFASGFVALLAVVLLLSLVWIGGRPVPLPDPVRDEPPPPGARRRRGATVMDAEEPA